jgi:mannose-6-phosphate isomerase-like protein (cupin superfamily)
MIEAPCASPPLPAPYLPTFVGKSWGHEDVIANGNGYCGKLLHVDAGRRSSWHYHKTKHETYHLLSGRIEVRLGREDDPAQAEVLLLQPGQCLQIPPGVRHQFVALQPSVIAEFSTVHREADTVRVGQGKPS